MMPKIILKTEKRPTTVSDHAIARAVERAYSVKTASKDTEHHYGKAKTGTADALLQSNSRKKK